MAIIEGEQFHRCGYSSTAKFFKRVPGMIRSTHCVCTLRRCCDEGKRKVYTGDRLIKPPPVLLLVRRGETGRGGQRKKLAFGRWLGPATKKKRGGALGRQHRGPAGAAMQTQTTILGGNARKNLRSLRRARPILHQACMRRRAPR